MPQSATVFGGTGFLGRRIVGHLREAGFAVRAAARRPERDTGVEAVQADVNDDASVAAALAGAAAGVNAVSLYVESGGASFRSVHVTAAGRVARLAREAGVERFVHVSGIGADANSRSAYIKSRGDGEAAVRAQFPTAVIVRPAVMFGPGDAFVTPLAELLRRLPAFPLFGDGRTRLQPVHVEDVAAAVAGILRAPEPRPLYELAGPRVYRYEELVRTIAEALGRQPILLPMPFALWQVVGRLAELLPRPPITGNQVELMQIDNVAASDAPGFAALGLPPTPLEEVLPQLLAGG